jgi:hypothetical protein
MNIDKENGKYKIKNSFPRNYDPLFEQLFETYLNITSLKTMPNLEAHYINKFVPVFEKEVSSSFKKSEQYLANLNKNFKSTVKPKT